MVRGRRWRWRGHAALLLLALAGCGADGDEDSTVDISDGSACEDRDDRWAVHGTNCERMKRMCDDDGYSELVRSWCPVSCGLCVPADSKDSKATDNPDSDASADGTHSPKRTSDWNFMDSDSNVSEASRNSSNSSGPPGPNRTSASQEPAKRTASEFSKAASSDELEPGELANVSNSCPEGNLSNGTCASAAKAAPNLESGGQHGHESSEPVELVASPNASGSVNASLVNRSQSPLPHGAPLVGLREGSLSSLHMPVKSGANISFPGPFRRERENRTDAVTRNLSMSNISAGKALLLLEELEEAAETDVGSEQSGKFDLSNFEFQIVGGAGALGTLNGSSALDLDLNFSLPLDPEEHGSEGAGGRRATRLEQLGPARPSEVEHEDKEHVCPEGWERVVGDVYGGDQWTGDWRHSAESMEDCAWRCLRQAGCGSFEYSPSKKRCYRNSQTRPTHEQDRQDFVFCRRRPCPSFKTEEACVGPGVSAGYHSKEVKMRPGSYCIWSSGHCQAPMACTDSDCFLPDGGLPGMELPSRYTLWISKAGLQASMGKLR